MPNTFLEKLRMQNIFPPAGGTPMGMPNLAAGGGGELDPNQLFSMIQQSRDMDQRRNLNLDNEMRSRARQDENYKINRGMIPQIGGQMNTQDKQVVFDPGNQMTPFQKESLKLREQEIGQKGGIAEGKQEVSERRAQLAEKIASGRATDAEKNEYTLGQIQARGEIGSRQIQERGAIGDQQIDRRAEDAVGLQGTRGSQALAQIAARTAGQMEINAAKPVDGQLPTQSRVAEANAARQLMNTNPELSKFITIDNNGNPSIKSPSVSGKYWGNTSGPTQTQYDEINNILYPPTKPVVTKPTSTTTSTTPKSSEKPLSSRWQATVK